MGLSAGAAIRENPGSAAGACCCQCCCCCCFDDDCACLFTTGHISYWYDRIITTVFAVLRLQPARDSRHTVCHGTSSSGCCLVIVLRAVMTCDQSIGTRKGGRGKFCMVYRSAGRTRGAPAQQWPSAVGLKKADPRARSAGLTGGSAENNSRVMMA